MESTKQALKHYLHHVLNTDIELKPWKGANRLPFFMRDAYSFYEAKLFNKVCIFMEARDDIEQSPAKVRDHSNRISSQSNELCIYLRSTMSSYNRKRLIDQHVSFVVPGNQLYLPDLGMDLREHFRKTRTSKKHIGPAAQAVVIHALVFGLQRKITPSELAEKLGYTRMTMTRALDDLEASELGELNRKGRERQLHFPSEKRQLWDRARPLMQNPVKKRLKVKNDKRIAALTVGGLSALSSYSMLNPPRTPIIATSASAWKTLKQSGVEELPFLENDACEVELWRYEPDLFAKDHLVDPFSLYLSLASDSDPRVIMALDEMIGKVQW